MDQKDIPYSNVKKHSLLKVTLEEARNHLKKLTPEKRISWAYEQFEEHFSITTSFGIQSAVLLNMVHQINSKAKIKVIWVDTGYLPSETYQYAEELTDKLNLDVEVIQSTISPARMEALHGKLWTTQKIEDLEKYHLIRKVEPLEKALSTLEVQCWASGVRKNQTSHRGSMTLLDEIRNRLSLRPILEWTQKDIFYYMQKNHLPQHPLFEKGYSTVGDWHSSGPDGDDGTGRNTRFGGLKEECGIHLSKATEEK